MFNATPVFQFLQPAGGPGSSSFPPQPPSVPFPAYPLMQGFAPPTFLMGPEQPLHMNTVLGAKIRPVWARSEEQGADKQAPEEIMRLLSQDSTNWPRRAQELADEIGMPYDAWYGFLGVLGFASRDLWQKAQDVRVREIAEGVPAHMLVDTLWNAKIPVYNP